MPWTHNERPHGTVCLFSDGPSSDPLGSYGARHVGCISLLPRPLLDLPLLSSFFPFILNTSPHWNTRRLSSVYNICTYNPDERLPILFLSSSFSRLLLFISDSPPPRRLKPSLCSNDPSLFLSTSGPHEIPPRRDSLLDPLLFERKVADSSFLIS